MTSAYGWDGAVNVRLSVRNGRDYAVVTLWPGPNQDSGPSLQVWEGYIDAKGREAYEGWTLQPQQPVWGN
jgi:hypothetical protein